MIALKIFLTFILLFALWFIVWNLYDGLKFFLGTWKTLSKSDKITIINISIVYVFMFVVVLGVVVATWLFI